ncbi:hypothetical protein ACIP98_03030 [Streptomyces sp. NPDC088354]|uniref:hypothetical protein n=1 Tax=Streptomyces sp. NPDC088354 TaxID=3365856 RepID=UPI0037F6F017
MAVEPRHDMRLRVRLRGYLLAVLISAGWVVIGHWWLAEPWSASAETMLLLLAVAVLYSEIRAWRLRRTHRMPD